MDKKLKLKTELTKKLKKETSATGTGASVTPGDGLGVATKYAFGKSNNKGTPKNWKPAPSVPNRKSKAMDYKELWEADERILTGGIPFRKESGKDYDKITITEPLPDEVKNRMIAKFRKAGWDAKPNNASGITAVKKKYFVSDSKELEEGELKPGVKYDYKGDSGWISTGGSSDPKYWKFLGKKEKYPYLSVKADLVPSEKQPGKYDGAFDLGMGKGHHIDEMDINDPILMAMRAKKDAPIPQISKPNRVQNTIKSTISMLLKKRAEIERDMEQEAEPEGGPIADKYGDMLNKIDKAITKLKGQGEWGPETDPYMDKGEIEKRAAMMNEAIHIGTDTKTDSDIYFEPSTGIFYINVIDAAGNRWNKLQVNTIDDVLAKFPNWKWTKEGEMEFQPEEQDDDEDDYDWFTNTYMKEDNLEEAKQEWAVKNIEAMVNDYAAQKGLDFRPVDKKQQVNQYGSKKTIYIYKLGDKSLVMIDDKAAGAPRLNNFIVAVGTLEPGSMGLKDSLSVSKFGSWGVEDIITMLDKAFKNKENVNENYARFRNETKQRSKSDQFHQAVKQVKKKMNEINRIFEYVDRLKTELSEGEDLKYKKYTENAFQQIKESAKQLFLKSTKLK